MIAFSHISMVSIAFREKKANLKRSQSLSRAWLFCLKRLKSEELFDINNLRWKGKPKQFYKVAIFVINLMNLFKQSLILDKWLDSHNLVLKINLRSSNNKSWFDSFIVISQFQCEVNFQDKWWIKSQNVNPKDIS